MCIIINLLSGYLLNNLICYKIILLVRCDKGACLYMNRKNINGKTVSFSRTEQVHVIKPCDLNGGGRLFGGALLSMLDEIAGIVASAIPVAIM